MADTGVAATEAEAAAKATEEERTATLLDPKGENDTTDLNNQTAKQRVSSDDNDKSAIFRRSRSDPANIRKYLAALAERAFEDKTGVVVVAAAAGPISSVQKASSRDETSSAKLSGVVNAVSANGGGRIKHRRFSNSAAATPTLGTPISGLGASLSSIATTTTTTSNSRVRVYRSSLTDKMTTRDIAALDFLLGIPLEAEESIVQHGWMLQQRRKQIFRANGLVDEEDDDDLYGSDEDTVPLEPPDSVASRAQLASHSNSHHGRWWGKWVQRESTTTNSGGTTSLQGTPQKGGKVGGELELPTPSMGLGSDFSGQCGTPGKSVTQQQQLSHQPPFIRGTIGMSTAPTHAPGRRLEGDEAVLVQIPLKVDTVTRQKSIALQAATREWEIKVAHGLMMGVNNGGHTNTIATATGKNSTPTQNPRRQQPMLDGRLFFSASGSYPIGVFSLKQYEPKREEAAQRQMKLEARGGGGSHFVMPSRDWRGITFRALLPRNGVQARNQKAFNCFLQGAVNTPTWSSSRRMHRSPVSRRRQLQRSDDATLSLDITNADDDSDSSVLSSSSAEDAYIPGILDDPEMVLGRHRNVMIGDCVTGCIVASTIQFVKPTLLKADLNQKFRERFDGWEPKKSQRKYIGACVINGIYTLVDPTESQQQQRSLDPTDKSNLTKPSPSSSSATPTIIRMPPSLTLSKIRNAKRQALMAFVNANLEIGTVALAFVYFERLCLSCRVDKSNRRLCFASCLLLACKINEPNEVLVMREDANVSGTKRGDEDEMGHMNIRKTISRLQTSIRPSKRSSSMFASLLGFFTEVWSLSLEHLFAAEWGVFAALRFSLHVTPSQVAFHFKRLMKTLEWNSANYLGPEMFAQWQQALATEEEHKLAREMQDERRRIHKERQLQQELQKEIRGKRASKGKATPSFQLREMKPKAKKEASGKERLKAHPTGNDVPFEKRSVGSVAIDIPIDEELELSDKEMRDKYDDGTSLGI